VHKPRALLWEWLVLGSDSPLRQLLRDAAERDGLGRGAFEFLPALRFFPARGQLGGEVERVALEPLRARSRESRRALAEVVGRSLALWSWLGVADLHWENLVLGVDAVGRIVFGPLDVEMILADLALPTETKLLPDADPEYAVICQHACGVRRVLPYLGKPVDPTDLLTMAGAYRELLAFLEHHAGAIAKLLSSLPGLRTTPIRVCLRGTGDYVNAGAEPLWPPLLEAERVQLERGDIPYFFRLYGRAGIHYYGDPTLRRIRRLPLKGDVPKLEPLLDIARGLRSASRRKLRQQGLLTLLGAFDHPELAGQHVSQDLKLTFGKRQLVVELGRGQELRSPRNPSALVSSVYQPCRCGEVRTVFVPAVTRCRAAAGSV
jgi:hypothetical protein